MTKEIHLGKSLEPGFSVYTATSLRDIHKEIQKILSDPSVWKIITIPLILPVTLRASHIQYKDTPITIRRWTKTDIFPVAKTSERYDIALKLVRYRK